MGKQVHTGPTPLDHAVADFVKRVVETGNALNHMLKYEFIRSLNELQTVTITFASDNELIHFGEPKRPTLDVVDARTGEPL